MTNSWDFPLDLAKQLIQELPLPTKVKGKTCFKMKSDYSLAVVRTQQTRVDGLDEELISHFFETIGPASEPFRMASPESGGPREFLGWALDAEDGDVWAKIHMFSGLPFMCYRKGTRFCFVASAVFIHQGPPPARPWGNLTIGAAGLKIKHVSYRRIDVLKLVRALSQWLLPKKSGVLALMEN